MHYRLTGASSKNKLTSIIIIAAALTACQADGNKYEQESILRDTLGNTKQISAGFSSSQDANLLPIETPLEAELDSNEEPEAAESNIEAFDFEPAGVLTSNFFPKRNSTESQSKVTPLVHNPNYVGLCTELSINQWYNLTVTAGTTYCIYFDIPTDSRTEFMAVNQTSTRQVSMEVFHDLPANYTFTSEGTSNLSGAVDNVLHYTESGHYYMQFVGSAGDGGQIQFAAGVNTNIDQYEPNDDVPTSAELPSGYNKISANLDHQNEEDWFNYLAPQGQDVVVGLYVGSNAWILEVLTQTGWQQLNLNERYTLSSGASSVRYNIRVRRNSVVAFNSSPYNLVFGPRIADISDYEVNPPEDDVLIRMPYGTGQNYYPTQVHKNVAWKAKIKDSKGYPIEGVKIILSYGATEVPGADTTAMTGADGFVREQITFPGCTGDFTSVHTENLGPYAGTYETEYDIGGWKMAVPDTTSADDIGVGGNNVPFVSIAHICDQNLL